MMRDTVGSERQPTSDDLLISSILFDEMLAHCRKGYPNEACGILAGKDRMVTRTYAMTNTEGSPLSYLMDPSEQFRVMKDMRSSDLIMLAIFHSHPSSRAFPSAKDVSLAFYDDCVYVIVSLAEETPVVKGFSIRDGEVGEIAVRVVSP